MRNRTAWIGGLLLTVMSVGVHAMEAQTAKEEYLADLQHRFLFVQQGWGQLGINTCAHAGGQPAEPLRIGDREYARGLGLHAHAELVVDLAGEYARFESLAGVQRVTDAGGSVEIKVFVDEALKFDSGLIRQDSPPREISLDVAGAQELRVVVTDGGDGITWDCANLAEARLIRSATPMAAQALPGLDIAPFAEVVTSDAGRTEGSRANRIQEYHADDVYIETPVLPGADGAYRVAATPEKPGCLGLKWLERRRLRTLGFELADGSAPVSPADIQVQCWVGESAWQGGYRPLEGEWSQAGRRWTFQPNWASRPKARGGTRKVRLIFARPVSIQRMSALAPTPTGETTLRVQLEKPLGEGPAFVEAYNGEFVGRENPLRAEWPQDRPLSLAVRYGKPRAWTSDTTVLRFRLPGAAFGVSVDDVLAHGCVYVRDLGLYVTQDPPSKSLAEYKQEIAGRKTLLEEVRSQPDQTFAQATKVLHNPAQNLQPTLLSLSCDNNKITLHRNGRIQFSAVPENNDKHVSDMLDQAGQITPTFGSGKHEKLTRSLDGGWMPVVVNAVEENGVVYRQRTFVAPSRLANQENVPVGVLEFTVENVGGSAADASLALSIMANAPKADAAEIDAVPAGAVAYRRGRLVAFVQTPEAKPLKLEAVDDGVRLVGSLPTRATSRIVVYLPLVAMRRDQHGQFGSADDLLRATREHWTQQLAGAMQVDVPDPLLANVIKASQVHCLIAARNEEKGARIAPWIASVAYGPLESEANSIIRGMDYFGYHDFARRSLDYFIHRYNAEGFLTTGYTIMGTGWHLWMLGEHYELNPDKAWLGKVAPEVSRVCDWVVKHRAKTLRPQPDGSKPAEYGLIPPGVMADWNAFAYYFCLNGYFAAGLRSTAEALADIGVAQASGWTDVARAYQEDILRAYAWTRARMPVYLLRDGTSVPGYPSQVHGPGPTGNFFPGEDGNRSWCYDVELGSHHLIPFGILAPDSREAAWMMDHMEDVQFLADGWFDFPAERSATDPFNYGGFAKVQPYYCRNGEINAMRDDVKPFVRTYFNSLVSLLNYENLSLQEHFAGVAAWNKTHETGYLLHLTRLMMVMERGDELWLAPFATDVWLEEGKTLGAKNAPTRFGPVSYRLASSVAQGHIDATIEPPTRTAPRQIVLRLRHPEGKPLRSATVNGRPHQDFEPGRQIIRLAPAAGQITVRASY